MAGRGVAVRHHADVVATRPRSARGTAALAAIAADDHEDDDSFGHARGYSNLALTTPTR